MRDLKTEIHEFYKFGKDTGKLTKMEILDFIRGLRISNEQMKGFCDRLMSHGIEIVDDTEWYDAKLDLETGEHYWRVISPDLVKLALEYDNPLSPREVKVMRYRYGLEDGKLHSFRQVQKVFGITKERIRQIEGKLTRMWEIERTVRNIKERRRRFYND